MAAEREAIVIAAQLAVASRGLPADDPVFRRKLAETLASGAHPRPR